MTLNIVLTSPHAVYLSGDFRWSRDGKAMPEDYNQQKIFPIGRLGWSALISYCGLASGPGVPNMGAWVDDQLASLPIDASSDRLIAALMEADRILARTLSQLAFTVVGFDGRNPFVAVLSNFDVSGRDLRLTRKLTLSKLRPKQPEVRFHGDHAHVTPEERASLKAALSGSDLQNVPVLMAQLNASAAQRTATISKVLPGAEPPAAIRSVALVRIGAFRTRCENGRIVYPFDLAAMNHPSLARLRVAGIDDVVANYGPIVDELRTWSGAQPVLLGGRSVTCYARQ